MSDDKYSEDDPERTLVTLDQLSQTIEVMTSVVNRLRRHLSEQIKAQLENRVDGQWETRLEALLEAQQLTEQNNSTAEPAEPPPAAQEDSQAAPSKKEAKRESFVVEINQEETAPHRKTSKTLH